MREGLPLELMARLSQIPSDLTGSRSINGLVLQTHTWERASTSILFLCLSARIDKTRQRSRNSRHLSECSCEIAIEQHPEAIAGKV